MQIAKTLDDSPIIESLSDRVPSTPPAGNHFVEPLLLAWIQLAGPVVDALGVQPDAQHTFCLVAGFVVPGPLVACGQVRRDLG